MKRIFGAALLGTFFSFHALADVVVVVSPDNEAVLSSQSVKRIFLGQENEFSTGEESTPVNQPVGLQARNEFDNKILKLKTARVTATLSKLVFTGRAQMPLEAASDAEVIELIKKDKSVIGYIDSSSVTDDVKVVDLD
ncbi:phosphate ABC transporter substrate-binding protein [Glaciecola siphonariae]|uniref:Phosphate ABC transporter substrate-binding protein n=1 Tax=Glaciecola siphonariae TaxID=521012 RepID=A0ABV9LZ71_9ALTE